MLSRLAYRTRQFWNALPGSHKRVESQALLPYLSTSQVSLFRRMDASGQTHARLVLERLIASGQMDRDLLAAALLHDVGKVLFPQSLLQRVLVVLGKRFLRRRTSRWGMGSPHGLRRPFVVAVRHPEWGADLARQAGSTSRTIELILHHQDASPTGDTLLAALQAADNEN